MRKITAIIILAVCLTMFSACSDVKGKTAQSDSAATAEQRVTAEPEAVTEAVSAESVQTEAAETTAVSETQANDADTDEAFIFYDDLKQAVMEQHTKSCEMQWKYLMSCPYELDYDDTVSDSNNVAYRVIGADFNDILADYNTVFASNITENGVQTSGDRSAEKLQEKYRVSQYGTYCTDGGRGKNKAYLYTYPEFVSYEDNILKLNAISVYENEDGSCYTEENPFTIVEIDGQWKTWEFTLPY